ncbi:nicotinamide-nucleotide amidohydrolase family protein [Marinobacter salinexigens]|uniref:Nicotinamide-nucleotide amidohydrolase family protein n=1 Tax=Marinobacter salinexigens TaxID=2919747 RepID=A0A5B0V9M3_9GAMM|nr:nicotinamide-nucleotide amidohydrolase family protein [Marinobacter salinexigens]KAA1171277.1 nicotinamide-nucleotide amidohydrolase family protein [Marinobacter salinexigens]
MPVSDAEMGDAAITLGELLEGQGRMIVTAESCTGGWVAKTLTDKAGSSAYVTGGLVTYSNEAKIRLLGVSEQSLDIYGAVSEAVVREMVAGAVSATGSDVAVAISGVAGPGGGSKEKPVGTVWFAWGTGADRTETGLKHFEGNRDDVRRQAVLFALQSVTGFLERL